MSADAATAAATAADWECLDGPGRGVGSVQLLPLFPAALRGLFRLFVYSRAQIIMNLIRLFLSFLWWGGRLTV